MTATSVFLYESVAKLISAYPARKIGAAPATNPWLHFRWPAGSCLGCCASCSAIQVSTRTELVTSAASRSCAAVLLTWISGELVVGASQSHAQELRPEPSERNSCASVGSRR